MHAYRRSPGRTAITWTGAAAAAGGVAFATFFLGSLLKKEVVPWPVPLFWHATAIFLLTAGAVGIHRSAHGSAMQTRLGWSGVALVVAGQLFSLETTMLGFVIYGAAMVMAPRRPGWGGALLVVGAVGFLAATALNGPFWGDPNPRPATIPGLTFGVSLLLIAFGWIVLGVSHRPKRATA